MVDEPVVERRARVAEWRDEVGRLFDGTPATPEGTRLRPFVERFHSRGRPSRPGRGRRDGPSSAALRDLRRAGRYAAASRRRSATCASRSSAAAAAGTRVRRLGLALQLRTSSVTSGRPAPRPSLPAGRGPAPLRLRRGDAEADSSPTRSAGCSSSSATVPAITTRVPPQPFRPAVPAGSSPPRSWAASTSASSSYRATRLRRLLVARAGAKPARAMIAASVWLRSRLGLCTRRARRPAPNEPRRHRRRRRLLGLAAATARPTPARRCSCSKPVRARRARLGGPRPDDRRLDNGQHVLMGCYDATLAFLGASARPIASTASRRWR